MSTKPVVLFVHGAWQTPKHYESVTQLFEQNGFTVVCPQLPTAGGPPSMKMYDDAKVIRAILDRLIEVQHREVVVIGHAYGGIVMTEAVHASLGKRQRKERGLTGGVQKLVYVSAFMPPLGKSLVSSIGNTFPPFTTIKETGQLTIQDPAHHFYNDVSVSTQQYYISLLGTHPATAQLTPTTYAAFEHHPVTYLFCKEDQAFPYEWQQKMVEGCGVAVEGVTCDAGHSPFISQMESVLGLVQ